MTDTNIENKSFKELLRASLKSDETEEWLDIHFNRPVGLFFALMWHRLGVKPNAITIMSIFLGIGAGYMFYFTDLTHNLFGIFLMMMADFCDSTDGQLARLTNQRSMKGRCLDGFAGNVWFFAIYLAIALRLWNQPVPGMIEQWGIWGLALAALASLLSHSPQTSLSDYYRQIHLYFLKGKDGSELDSYAEERRIVEELREKKDVFWDWAFHINYRNYCKSQEHRTPAFQRLHAKIKNRYGSIEALPLTIREEFLRNSRSLIPLTNLLTLNSRLIMIYITCLLKCPWVYLLVEITIYNLIYIYMHKRHEALCERLSAEIQNS